MIKRVFKSAFLVSLTSVFGIAGFYMGSKDQTLEIIVAKTKDEALVLGQNMNVSDGESRAREEKANTGGILNNDVKNNLTASDKAASVKNDPVKLIIADAQPVVSDYTSVTEPNPETKVS